MTVCEVIKQETGQDVTESTPIEELGIDSLEYLDLLLVIAEETGRKPADGLVETVADLIKEAA